jgi:type I restriction enzyme, S subunit
MESEVVSIKLKDCIERIVDNRGKTPPNSEEKTPYGMIEVNAIKGYSKAPVYSAIKKFVTKDVFENWFRSGHPIKDDVLISTVGSIGEVAISEGVGCIAQNVIGLRPDKKIIDGNYLYYLLKNPSMKMRLTGLDISSVQPSIKVPHLLNLEVELPRLEIQKTVSVTLSSLDKKIELNRQLNQTLEAMAQALFKSWFVDFDPVIDNALAAGNPIPDAFAAKAARRQHLLNTTTNSTQPPAQPLPADLRQLFPSSFQEIEEMGWVPEDWSVCPLGSLISVKRGGSPRPIHDYMVEHGLPWVKISDATASDTRFIQQTKGFIKHEGLNKTVYLKKGALILSNSATPGLPKFLELDACIHDGWLYFPQKEVFSDYYLYQLFLVIRDQLIQQGNGSIFTNLKTDILKAHMLVKPSKSVLTIFDGQLRAIHEKLLCLGRETKSLIDLRDSLLPKLLSGQLRIPDAEALLVEVDA